MKNEIIRILKENEFGCKNSNNEWINGVYSEHFYRIADEIVKLLATPAVSESVEPVRGGTVCQHCGKKIDKWQARWGYCDADCMYAHRQTGR